LVKNADLLAMARMGKASTPMDLMTYRPEDKQPSIFLLNEDNRQRILTVFNWTEGPQSHMFRLEDLGFGDRSAVRVVDVLRGGAVKADGGQFDELLSPHSVRMLKVTNTSIPEAVAEFDLRAPAAGKSGASLEFSALTKNESEPILGFVWEFGDGVKVEGSKVIHTYTQPGQYSIRVTASGLNGRTAEKTLVVTVTGYVPTVENPAAKQRFKGEQ
jgi:hypothetical protein